MAKQLLIYEQIVPLSPDKHLHWCVESGKDYSFTAAINSLPLMTVEFTMAASEYVIIFTGNQEDEAIMPAIILGLRNQENLYLKKTGEWKAKYIPAFIRRYPFVFSKNNQDNSFTLCIDENYSGCNQEGRGRRLFDSQGKKTEYLDHVLNFLKDYQTQFQRTQIFAQKLKQLDLLEPMQASVSKQSGEKIFVQGFMAISRHKLKALTGRQLSELTQLDELELIYLHLQSMRNFSSMAELLAPETEDAML